MSTPPIPDGSDNFATWAQWAHRGVTDARFFNTPSVKVARGPSGGWSFTSVGGSQGNGAVKLYAITQIFGAAIPPGQSGVDYIGVTPWGPTGNDGDGGTSGSQITVAKSIDGRQPAFETIDDEYITYTYSDDNHRVATPETGSQENHVMHKRYMVWPGEPPEDSGVDNNQILVAIIKSQGGTGVLDMNGNQLMYYEISPNREWALASS